jgi:hypothetical protein
LSRAQGAGNGRLNGEKVALFRRLPRAAMPVSARVPLWRRFGAMAQNLRAMS